MPLGYKAERKQSNLQENCKRKNEKIKDNANKNRKLSKIFAGKFAHVKYFY